VKCGPLNLVMKVLKSNLVNPERTRKGGAGKSMFNMWKKAKGSGSSCDDTRRTRSASELRPTAGFDPVRKGYEIVASVFSDVGCLRELNEDTGKYVDPEDSELKAAKGVLLLVADGVGGHSAGEVASSTAAEVISRVYYEHQGDMNSALVEAFREANREICKTASADPRLKGMGTTCSALVVNNGAAISANVGDSRLYLIRNDDIYLMTEDDSVVGAMVKHGLITREDARHHPDKNVIVSALGGAPEVSVSTWYAPLPVRVGDHFLVCSDGLSDLVNEQEMKQAVISAPPEDACLNLIALAKHRGGHDNITVGILGVFPSQTGMSLAIDVDQEFSK
jgi:PPM family protein phosphatase